MVTRLQHNFIRTHVKPMPAYKSSLLAALAVLLSVSSTQLPNDAPISADPIAWMPSSASTPSIHQSGLAHRRLRAAGMCHELTKDNLAKYAVANTLMITIGDLTTMDYFGFNWIKNAQDAGVTYWMLAALDEHTSEYVTSKGVKQCFTSPFALSNHIPGYSSKGVTFEWGGAHFRAANWRKVHILARVVKLGFNVLYSDMDVAWLRNPLNYFSGTPQQMSMVVTTDLLALETRAMKMHDESLAEPRVSANINTGVFYVRAGPGGNAVMEAWSSVEEKRISSEQQALNGVWKGPWEDRGEEKIFAKYGIPELAPEVPKGMTIMNKTVVVGQLSIALFGHSYTWFVTRVHQTLGLRPYEVHFIWSGNGRHSKRQRMREAMLYHDPPEYYSEPKLLSVQLRYLKMPEDYNFNGPLDWWINRTEPMVQFHLRAMHFQLGQLYYAFALALATNRTLIMPPLRCYCVKNWFMTKGCKLEEDPSVKFPFPCTLGDVMKPKLVVDGLDVGKFGKIHIREHSFMENPRTPEKVKSNMRIVRASNTTTKVVAKGDKVLMVPAKMKDGPLREALAGHKEVQWLHVTRPMLTFGGFGSAEVEKEFSAAMNRATTYWCCRSPRDMEGLKLPDRVRYRLLPLEKMDLSHNITGREQWA